MEAIYISLAVIALRVLVPFTLWRWPLGGVVLNIIVDSIDRPILEHYGWGLYANQYQLSDKVLDIWYMLFLFHIIQHWTNGLARKAGTVLFLWRFAGVLIAYFYGWWGLLVFAPNVFEFFYIFWTICLKWFPGFRLTSKKLAMVLLAISVPVMINEARLHLLYPNINLQLLDRFIFPWKWQ
jgi:hypothetical protein